MLTITIILDEPSTVEETLQDALDSAITEVQSKLEDHENVMFELVREHVGHELECVLYGTGKDPRNVAIECNTCNEVILSYDKTN